MLPQTHIHMCGIGRDKLLCLKLIVAGRGLGSDLINTSHKSLPCIHLILFIKIVSLFSVAASSNASINELRNFSTRYSIFADYIMHWKTW